MGCVLQGLRSVQGLAWGAGLGAGGAEDISQTFAAKIAEIFMFAVGRSTQEQIFLSVF